MDDTQAARVAAVRCFISNRATDLPMGCFVSSDLPPLSGAQVVNVALDIEQLINLFDRLQGGETAFFAARHGCHSKKLVE
ncbi:hypothetical protein [Sinorhizobium prairiense]|uniref:hypothetical protein n=1 Tax=unclassified Sinorhizobium TaxID=2613772 RepID=UPI0023D831A7|nr:MULTISPECIES: hypothetical protein [unclassified Sinorhizobium]WEJ08535.1 hypothetical protein N0Q90_02365 [Sinorhizobium sp. M103]WEJ13963.1 hypothetical protein N0Q91_00355 [Sinorhizobium sp. K101]WEJ35565.1 hypothetical protein N0R80_00350 [Sinorhizobium sp. C101]